MIHDVDLTCAGSWQQHPPSSDVSS